MHSLIPLKWITHGKTNWVTFLLCLLTDASLFIHLISWVLTSASSLVLPSNSPWKQERRENWEKSSASPEQRRGSSRYTWYDGILSTNEAHMVLKKTHNIYPEHIFPRETHFCLRFSPTSGNVGVLPWKISTRSCKHMLNQWEKQQKELADRLFSVRCWQHRRKAIVTVNRRHGAGESRCVKPVLQTSAFVLLPSQQARTLSLLASDLHWHLLH